MIAWNIIIRHHYLRTVIVSIILLTAMMLNSCSTTPPSVVSPPDPLEHLNRNTMRFNDKLDKAVITPVARGYIKVTPYVMRRSVSNFFNNLELFPDMGNDILQAEGQWFQSDAWRLIINSTVGIGGLFDPASHIGLMPHSNDFGMTLNRWHIFTPYFVIPFLGPSTLGTTVGILPDYFMSFDTYLIPLRTSVMADVVKMLNSRAMLLQRQEQAAGLVLDPYTFYRSAYLQYRQHALAVNLAGPQFDQNDNN
jgi:phospholipid-binding lipoprotein MlaA